MIDSLHLMDLTAFVAVVGGVIILILLGHATAELLTAASAASTGMYSLWARHPRLERDSNRNRPSQSDTATA